MPLASLVLLPSLLFAFQDKVDLGRVFVKGEKLEYSVNATLHEEFRAKGLDTWLPDVVDFQYGFSLSVQELKTDGIAVVRYQRPSVTQIGDDEKKTVEKVNDDLQLTLSPYNEVLEMKNLGKKTDLKGGKKDGDGFVRFTKESINNGQLGGMIGGVISELQRLSAFLGSLETSLDLNPRTTFDEVKVGDTWKRTFGYTPQKLSSGSKEKQEMQRIDYTYTYKGLTESEGQKVLRVEAVTDVKGDLAAFINGMFNVKADETGLSKIPLTFKGRIEFDLDPKTKHPLAARATSESSFAIWLTTDPLRAVQEAKTKGRSVMKLVKRTLAKTK